MSNNNPIELPPITVYAPTPRQRKVQPRGHNTGNNIGRVRGQPPAFAGSPADANPPITAETDAESLASAGKDLAWEAAKSVPVLGMALSAVDAGKALAAGEYLTAAGEVAGMIPAVRWLKLGVKAGKFLSKAAKPAKAISSAVSAAKAGGKVRKAKEIPCFKRNQKHDKDEFDRQLKEQEDGINEQSPEDFQKARSDFDPANRSPSEQQAVRDDYFDQRMTELDRQGIRGQEAEDMVTAEMKGKDATHAPDAIAGGTQFSGLGDRGVNRSIGPQWTQDKLDALDQAAAEAQARGDKKMNVKLTNCEDKPTS